MFQLTVIKINKDIWNTIYSVGVRPLQNYRVEEGIFTT